MALTPETEFAGQIKPSSVEYPYGEPQDVATSLDGRGTPWNERLCSDIFGFQQALLTRANIIPSGNPDNALESQYLDAIDAIIQVQFDILNQIQMSIPIYPEIQNETNTIDVTKPATGVLRIPAGVDILHNGSFVKTTESEDLNTLASRTYHIRWNAISGFSLNDLSDNIYNPDGLLEEDSFFDTTYNDMLVSRVVTNAQNKGTVTNLKNRINLFQNGSSQFINPNTFQDGTPLLDINLTPDSSDLIEINFARTPKVAVQGHCDMLIGDPGDSEINIGARAESRYQVACIYQRSTNTSVDGVFITYTAEA